ncbi:MAG: ABC transporter substrate-binding protein [Chloroflexota bacterium]
MQSSVWFSRKFRHSLRASLVGGFTFLLAACGGAASSSPPAASSPAPASSAAAAKPSAAASVSAKPAASAAAGGSATASAKPAASGAATGTPIKIGILDDVTGPGATEGALLRIDTDVVIDQINSTGGINGHPVQATYVDPKAQPDQALQFATQLAQQDNVDVLAGAIFSSECLGVQSLMPKLGLVYVPLNGCANEEFTAKSCSKFSFRVWPVGRQTIEPPTDYEIKTYGKKWGIIYPDYAFGTSQVAAYDAALKKFGGELTVKIPVPLGETNVTPYVSKIPTDGSINGLFNSENGTDLPRITGVMQQFGIFKKLPVINGALGRESFAGTYPAGLEGGLLTGIHQSNPIPGNQFDAEYFKEFSAMAKKDSQLAGVLGGPDKATPGVTLGYQAYTGMEALKLAMRASGFTGKADTQKLITAMENLNVTQPSLEFPSGGMIMNKADHQGRMPLFIEKISGQKEEVIQTIPADQLPQFGSCTAA